VLLARRRPGGEPGPDKDECARVQHRARILPGMVEYDSFAADYDHWAADMVDDVQWYVSLARDADEPIVELGVGTGRVAIPIARETGKRVLGIDTSPAMLAIGREKAGDLPIEFREGDMRELALDEPVGLIICPGRSLMHVRTWADKRRLFEHVAAALRPGGRFAWNVFAMSPLLAVENEQKGETRNVPSDNRIDLIRNGGVIPLWWMTRAEQEGLIDVAGLELEALHGGFHREPYDETTYEMVWIARKPTT
jgi:SAM-dependent methyltransferase